MPHPKTADARLRQLTASYVALGLPAKQARDRALAEMRSQSRKPEEPRPPGAPDR